MKTNALPRLALAAAAVVAAVAVAAVGTGSARAGEYVLAPKALDEVINPNFRIALGERASDYDRLDRADQVRAFIQVYKSLNNGEDPRLVPDDARYVAGGAVPYQPYVPRRPSQYINRRSGDLYTYVDGYGYRRTPGRRTPWDWFNPYGGTAYGYGYGAGPGYNYGVTTPYPTVPFIPAATPPERPSTPTVTEQAPPGGWGPPVARPRRAPVATAPTVHAGP
ncbi:MAG: hypothetical protein LIQ30_09930 [Planctomycetes bacterium]|nr:hypothetical protein [Planctomycetota bacterium]MCC8116876.1 hypothetical protein [Planctomycetota bacterium]MCD7896812.1 hypothetical protein [Planctomycetaceae bacterium]